MANAEIAKAFVTIIPSMQGAQQTIADELTSSMGSASETVGELVGTNIGGKASAALAKLAAPAAVATAAAAGLKQAFDLGESWDTVFDTIKVGTGATGDALKGLEDSAKSVASGTSASIDEVGSTLADLNTRTGATGDTLEGLTEQFLQLGEIGQSVDVNKATGAFNAWGISAEDMGGALDDLFLVSQSTGIGIDQLASTMGANASTMKALGFSFQDTAAMAGLFDKAGLNSSSMMGKLSKAATKLAKDGEDPAKAFDKTVGEMQKFLDKGDEAAAIDMASELFGTKGAAQFVQALESGTMNIDELSAALSASSGDIDANAEATKSFGQASEELKNKLAVAFEPLGTAVFTGASQVMLGICDGVDFLMASFDDLTKSIQSNEDVMQGVEAFGSILQDVGSIGASAFGAIRSAAGPLMGVLQPVGSFLGGAFLNAVKLISGGLKQASDAFKFFKNLFTGKISFPKITLPHITIKPSGWKPTDLVKGVVPSIGVQFYRKGGVLDNPTAIAVGGEAGREILVPMSGPEMNPYADAVADRLASRMGGGVTVNLYYTKDADASQMARDIASALNRWQRTGAV